LDWEPFRRASVAATFIILHTMMAALFIVCILALFGVRGVLAGVKAFEG
jgi:hypothetical protein